jgi:hypothetical protein
MPYERRFFLAAVTICAAALGACETGGPESAGSAAKSESALEPRVGSSPIFSIEGPGNGEPPFYQIVSVVILPDGGFAVADQTQRIVIVDSEGALVRSFGGSGEGPGEFVRLAWIQRMHGDSLLTYDDALGRATVFTIDGAYARTIKPEMRPGGSLPPRLLGVFEDGSLLAAENLLAAPPAGGSGIVRPDMVVSRHDSRGVFLDSLTVLPADERGIAEGVLLNMPFLRTTSVTVDGNRVHVSTGDQVEVATYDRDGALVRTLRVAAEPRPVTAAVLKSADVAALVIPLLPATLPAVSDVISDPLGGVWIGPYVVGSEGEDATWKVFNAGGDLAQNVQMPEGFRPLDIGESWVVGIWTDDFDVGHVRLYPLLRPDTK